jgi:hypothetical protein
MNGKRVNRTLRVLDILLGPRSLQYSDQAGDANSASRQAGTTWSQGAWLAARSVVRHLGFPAPIAQNIEIPVIGGCYE